MATTVLLTAKLFISHLIFINWICAVFACFIMWRQIAVVWQLSLNHLSNVLECRISEWGASLCGHLQTAGALISWQTTRYWHRPRQTLQSGSRCPHLFKYQSSVIISTIQRSGCISGGLGLRYIETFDNRKLTMWILFKTYFGKRTHRASVRAWGGGVQSSGPEEEYLLLPQPSPAQPSPAPVSGDRSVSHEDKTQDSGYFTNFAELLDPELQRREERCLQSFFSRHLECQASLVLCPRPSAHMAQMSSHTKGSNFLSTKWDLLQGCFQIRRGVK